MKELQKKVCHVQLSILPQYHNGFTKQRLAFFNETGLQKCFKFYEITPGDLEVAG